MRIVEAELVNREFEPGWEIVSDDVKLGKKYRVDLDEVLPAKVWNKETGKVRDIQVIRTQNGDGSWGFFPLEALKIKGDA